MQRVILRPQRNPLRKERESACLPFNPDVSDRSALLFTILLKTVTLNQKLIVHFSNSPQTPF